MGWDGSKGPKVGPKGTRAGTRAKGPEDKGPAKEARTKGARAKGGPAKDRSPEPEKFIFR